MTQVGLKCTKANPLLSINPDKSLDIFPIFQIKKFLFEKLLLKDINLAISSHNCDFSNKENADVKTSKADGMKIIVISKGKNARKRKKY